MTPTASRKHESFTYGNKLSSSINDRRYENPLQTTAQFSISPRARLPELTSGSFTKDLGGRNARMYQSLRVESQLIPKQENNGSNW